MPSKTDDLRIEHLRLLDPPEQVIGEAPSTSRIEETVAGARQAVQRVLHGEGDGVLRLPAGPGTLAVFRGQHALHRVTPVTGPRPRINSVLTYGQHPGMKLTEVTQKLFYGRTA